jgi:MYXO-CTERM domain-containing protein
MSESTPLGGRATRSRRIACSALFAFGVSWLYAGDVLACNAEFPERYRSDKTIWCVYEPAWASNQSDIEGFFPFGDQVIDKLIALFDVSPSNLPYYVEVGQSDGIAHTPSNFGPGVRVTGDAFWNEFGGVQGYWGYLLVLHEFVNQWTGLVTGGWPTDWWADHRSPFPNAMDYRIMDDLGLSDAARVHRDRFLQQGTDNYDPQVELFGETIFNLPGYGFEGYRRAFSYIQADEMKWNKLRDPPDYAMQTTFGSGNPSKLLSEYVIAYLSLGGRTDLTDLFGPTGVGGKPPSWTETWQAYTPDADSVGDIADAHCSLAAARAAIERDTASAAESAWNSAREAFWKGDYENATGSVDGYPGVCGDDCPAECGCQSTTNRCVAPWRADTQGTGGAGSGTGGTAATGGASNSGGTGGAATGAAGSGQGLDDSEEPEGGCSCRVAGAVDAASRFAWLGLTLSVLLGLWRRRRYT